MKIKTFKTESECRAATGDVCRGVGLGGLAHAVYVSCSELYSALSSSAFQKGAARECFGSKNDLAITCCMELRELQHGGYVFAEQNLAVGHAEENTLLVILFDDEQAARAYFAKASMRHTQDAYCKPYMWADAEYAPINYQSFFKIKVH